MVTWCSRVASAPIRAYRTGGSSHYGTEFDQANVSPDSKPSAKIFENTTSPSATPFVLFVSVLTSLQAKPPAPSPRQTRFLSLKFVKTASRFA